MTADSYLTKRHWTWLRELTDFRLKDKLKDPSWLVVLNCGHDAICIPMGPDTDLKLGLTLDF